MKNDWAGKRRFYLLRSLKWSLISTYFNNLQETRWVYKEVLILKSLHGIL